MNTVRKGRIGEEFVAHHLESVGYTIIERNFRTRTTEIDNIAQDDDSIVVIEVKSWRRLADSELEHAITSRKRESIIRGTRIFLSRHPRYRSSRIRFDVVFYNPESGDIKHLKHAFTETNSGW